MDEGTMKHSFRASVRPGFCGKSEVIVRTGDVVFQSSAGRPAHREEQKPLRVLPCCVGMRVT